MKFFDAHCDTITRIFDLKENIFHNSGHFSLDKLNNFECPVQVFAVWTEPIYYKNSLERALSVIDYYYEQEKIYGNIFSHANSYGDLIENQRNNKISGILSIEGGEPFCGKTEILRMFYRLGVRICSLTWNYKNELAFGVNESSGKIGLTAKGREFVSEIERIGMILDVSHLSDKAFYDVCDFTEKPFIASHSNSRKICPNPRNLTDSQIRIISERGGVLGINLYPDFLSTEKNADIYDILKHTEHIIDVGGEDSIGFGCDFDGVSYLPEGVSGAGQIEKLLELFEKEFGTEITEKIAFKNFFRLCEKNLI